MSDNESTRFSRAYRKGYDDAYDAKAPMLERFSHSTSNAIPSLTKEGQKESDSYDAGYNTGADDRFIGRPHAFRKVIDDETQRTSKRYQKDEEEGGSYSSSSSDNSDPDNVKLIGGLIGLAAIAVVLYVVYWLAVNLVLPLLLLNSALWLVIWAGLSKPKRQLLSVAAFAGGAYLLYDISVHLFSGNFVNNVVGDKVWIDLFVWVNAAALGVAAWFLTAKFWRDAQAGLTNNASKAKLMMTGVGASIAIPIIAVPLMYHIFLDPNRTRPQRADDSGTALQTEMTPELAAERAPTPLPIERPTPTAETTYGDYPQASLREMMV